MASTTGGPRLSQCSFCEKGYEQSDLIVAGQGRSVVCYDCIRVLSQLIDQESPPRPARPPKKGLWYPGTYMPTWTPM